MPCVGGIHQAQYMVEKSFAMPGGPDPNGARPVYRGVIEIPATKQFSPFVEQVGDPEFSQEIPEYGPQADVYDRVGVQFSVGRKTGLLVE